MHGQFVQSSWRIIFDLCCCFLKTRCNRNVTLTNRKNACPATGARAIEEVNVPEVPISLLTAPLLAAPLLIEHFETRFIRLTF